MRREPGPRAVRPGAELEYVGPPLPLAGVSAGDVGRVTSVSGGHGAGTAGGGWSCVVEFAGGTQVFVTAATADRYRRR